MGIIGCLLWLTGIAGIVSQRYLPDKLGAEPMLSLCTIPSGCCPTFCVLYHCKLYQ